MFKTLYDERWIGDHGIGRFAGELKRLLPGLVGYRARRRPWHPLDPAFLGAALWHEKAKLFFSPGYNSPVGWPKPFIFTLHDLNHLCVRENSNAAKRAYYKHIIRPACCRAAFVLTVSEYSKREIRAWARVSEQKIVNVGCGVGDPFTSEGPKHNPGYPYLLYVGSHKPHKNLDRLLKAYAISDTCREVRLVMTGTPSLSLRSQIEELSLGEQVQFVNLASNEALARLYRGALAFVFPSLYEGFGLPPLEAMACGIPVLTSNVCSLPEVMGNAGVLVNPLDVEAIADGIRRLVQDGELRARLRQAGLLRAKEFSWDETARKTLEVLHMAAARS
jgi:glycosyltransferase involved in cell wall biosynthesis